MSIRPVNPPVNSEGIAVRKNRSRAEEEEPQKIAKETKKERPKLIAEDTESQKNTKITKRSYLRPISANLARGVWFCMSPCME